MRFRLSVKPCGAMTLFEFGAKDLLDVLAR
jgi:hypothetical protein